LKGGETRRAKIKMLFDVNRRACTMDFSVAVENGVTTSVVTTSLFKLEKRQATAEAIVPIQPQNGYQNKGHLPTSF